MFLLGISTHLVFSNKICSELWAHWQTWQRDEDPIKESQVNNTRVDEAMK